MRRRELILAGIVAAATLIALLLMESFAIGPQYNGHSLRFWVSSLAHTTEQDQQATEAIQHINTNALPFLLQMDSTRDTPIEV